MPLKTGSGKKVISENVAEMIRSGYKPKVAQAAAYDMAKKPKEKGGK